MLRNALYLAWTVAVAVALFACGSDTVQKASTTPTPADDGGVLDDGALVDNMVVEPPDVAMKPSKVTATNETVTVLGDTRQYVLVVPKTYDAARKYALIVALHGDGQDGPSFHALLTFDDVAGDDAIVAYPTGAVDLFTPYDQNGDQLLVDAVVNDVKGKRSIDSAKVWGFGYSKGGFIANEIACRKPGVLKAMAIHAGGAPQEPQGPDGFPSCPGVQRLPVLVTGGDKDPEVGGVDYGAKYWAKVNGCAQTRTATTPAECLKADVCPAGQPVIYCVAPGVAHYPIWAQAVNVSWSFFRSLKAEAP